MWRGRTTSPNLGLSSCTALWSGSCSGVPKGCSCAREAASEAPPCHRPIGDWRKRSPLAGTAPVSCRRGPLTWNPAPRCRESAAGAGGGPGSGCRELVLWLLALAAPLVLPGQALIINTMAITALFALSLDLILGYAGIVSLGHAAF